MPTVLKVMLFYCWSFVLFVHTKWFNLSTSTRLQDSREYIRTDAWFNRQLSHVRSKTLMNRFAVYKLLLSTYPYSRENSMHSWRNGGIPMTRNCHTFETFALCQVNKDGCKYFARQHIGRVDCLHAHQWRVVSMYCFTAQLLLLLRSLKKKKWNGWQLERKVV